MEDKAINGKKKKGSNKNSDQVNIKNIKKDSKKNAKKSNKKVNKKIEKKIDLSVIIPVYNTEQYLNKCIDSVIQSCKNLKKNFKKSSEILVINDGSTGNTDQIMSKYLQKYKNLIKYYKNENQGIAVTRNFGILNSKGEYISFVDSDDYIDINYYSDAYDAIIKKNAEVVVSDIESINQDGTKFTTIAKENQEYDDKWGCFDVSVMPMCCNKIIKKMLFKNLEFPEKYFYEDLATIPIVMLRAENIVYVPKTGYKYYMRNDSTMRKEFNEQKFQIIDILKILFFRIDVLDSISRDYKQRAKVSVYYDRLFFELLNPLQDCSKEKRKKLTKIFCKKIQKLHAEVVYNKYYKIRLNQGRLKKVFFDGLMDFALYNNLPGLLNLILDKLVFYNKQYIYDKWSRKDAKK